MIERIPRNCATSRKFISVLVIRNSMKNPTYNDASWVSLAPRVGVILVYGWFRLAREVVVIYGFRSKVVVFIFALDKAVLCRVR